MGVCVATLRQTRTKKGRDRVLSFFIMNPYFNLVILRPLTSLPVFSLSREEWKIREIPFQNTTTVKVATVIT